MVDAPVFIIDDGSKVPAPGCHWRNKSPKGIAWVKNKSIELLMDAGVDHLFLFDDDCYPTQSEWWKPYIESGEHHLSYLFPPLWDRETTSVYKDSKKFALSSGTGCMQYYTRECIEKVGGMRTTFGRWSFEHIEHSQRIANAGLVEYPFQGIYTDAFYAYDEYQETRSAIDQKTRRESYVRNRDLYYTLYKDREPEFVDYRMR